jgi:thiol-disulfide isomerase/thioredoxin
MRLFLASVATLFALSLVAFQYSSNGWAEAHIRQSKEINWSGASSRPPVLRFISGPQLTRLKLAPPFSLTTLDGNRIDMDELHGKVVLVDFWATWCAPCREALPHIRSWAKKFKGQPLVILSVSLDSDEQEWREFIAKNGMTWPQYRDGSFAGPVATVFGVNAIPHTFIIDGNGAVQDEQIGEALDEAMLKKLIAGAHDPMAHSPKSHGGTENMTSDSQHNTANELVALARDRFGALSRAEENALVAATKGTLAVCGPNTDPNDPGNDPAKADNWSVDRQIRANLIRWMCVDPHARGRIDPKGLLVFGAKVVGKLDLTHASLPFAIALRRCRLMENAELASADLPELDLQGTRVLKLMADNIRVQGSVWLNNGFTGVRVRLLGAQIAGNLECNNGEFHSESNNPDEMALSADGATVKGGISLKGSRIEGQLRFPGAQIGGDLNCAGATLNSGPTRLALVADRLRVGGSVYLRDGFHANGQVRFLNAEIGSDLALRGGIITNPSGSEPNSGIAFNADRMNVKGSVFFRDGFHADGLVVFNGAHIGSNLEFDNSIFKSPSGVVLGRQGTALDAEGARVDGSAFFRNGFSAKGRVGLPHMAVALRFEWGGGIVNPNETSLDLTNASVGTLVDDMQSWPPAGRLMLDGFTYTRIANAQNVKTRLGWLARQKPFTPQPYGQFAKVLRDEGDKDGARQVLFEAENLRSREQDKGLSRLLSFTLRWSIGYGYYPVYSIGWLLLLIGAGCFLFNRGFAGGAIVPVDKDAYDSVKQSSKLPSHYPQFCSLVYSLESSVPLFKLGQTERWQIAPTPVGRVSTPACRVGQWPSPGLSRVLPTAVLARLRPILDWTPSPTSLRCFRLGQIVVGWILTTMFVLAVTGLVRKD